MIHSQTIEIPEQEVQIEDRPYWLRGKVQASGPLHQHFDHYEFWGQTGTRVTLEWEATEFDVLELELCELDEQGNETKIDQGSIFLLAHFKLKDLAEQYSQQCDIVGDLR